MKKAKKSTSKRFFNGDNSSLENKESVNINMITKFKSFFKRSFNSKFNNLKVRYKKDPKKGLALVLAIVALFSTLVGSSYAYLQYVSKTNNSTVINAGTLALTFKGSSNSIMLTGALPQSDSDGLANSAEYEFSIENTGSIPANYRLTLDNVCSTSSSYSIDGTSVTPSLCIPNEYIKVAIKEGNKDYKVLEKKTINNETSYIIDADSLKSKLTRTYKMKIWLDYDTPNTYSSSGSNVVIYFGKLGLSYEQGSLKKLDKSGANAPVLDEGMIPVYYDETSETWKKADVNNQDENNKWYDYNNKMWANSVTVSSTNRSKYQSASTGTEIPMSDILTMEVWIPRYKYKVWNYNADGTKTSNEQQIEITFEKGTAKTGEIACQDAISGTDGDPSETCKLKETNATCTDDTCNNKTYTHPAFTFGNEEIKGFWIGKFELTGTIDNITTKPNLSSIRSQSVSTFETNIMNMKNSNNQYGLNTNTDTHMIKNSEWGAVAYLSHSKYGTCTDGTCKEVNINNSDSYYTGRSGGSPSASRSTEGTYKYNDIYNKTTTMTGGTTITPTVTNDTTYPWTSSNGLYKSSNQGKNSTTTNLKFSFTAPTNNTYLSFDWSVSSESASYDYLYYTITKDGATLSGTGISTKIGGTSLGTTESALTYKNVSKKLDKGTYELTFTYTKDSSSAKGTDTGYIKNIKILDSPTVNVTKTPIGEGADGPSASTTHNIYGVYDMSGGAFEYTMGNVVSNDGSTMMSGYDTSWTSGYTGKIYDTGNYTAYTGVDYPNNKYYDKYSFGTSDDSKIRSKLGDGIKEVYKGSNGWYNDHSCLAGSDHPWFLRGGHNNKGTFAGVFNSYNNYGYAISDDSSRLIITP